MISVIKRGIDLISVDIGKENNQLKEVVIRYSTQMKLNKMGGGGGGGNEVTHEILSVFRKQSLVFLINVLHKLLEIAPIKHGFVPSCRIIDSKEVVTISSKKKKGLLTKKCNFGKKLGAEQRIAKKTP